MRIYTGLVPGLKKKKKRADIVKHCSFLLVFCFMVFFVLNILNLVSLRPQHPSLAFTDLVAEVP